MRIADLNWMQLESLVATEDRAVVPIGSTEQHAYLSLATDAILAERAALEAADPTGPARRHVWHEARRSPRIQPAY